MTIKPAAPTPSRWQIRARAMAGLVCLAGLVAACGGGAGAGHAPRTLAANDGAVALVATADPSTITTTAAITTAATATAAADGRKRALLHAGVGPMQMQDFVFFDEVQAAYPVLFGNLGPTRTFGPYTYRYDATTQNFLALTATDIVLMGPVVGSPTTPVVYASLATFCGARQTAKFCGFSQRRTLTVAGLEREFIVYVPWMSRHASNLPVVFMLHGTSGTGQQFFNQSGWREVADVEGFIAVFPTALRHCFYEDDVTVNGTFDADERRTPTKWAHGSLGDPVKMPLCTPAQIAQLPADTRAKVDHPLADDLGFFDAMVSDLNLNFVVDPKRLYVSGFSAGGQMSGRLAAERSTVFAALAAAAGPAHTPLPLAARPLSFIFTVGELDDRFTSALGVVALPLTDSGSTEAFKTLMARPHADPQQLDESTYTFASTTLYQTALSVYTYQSSQALPAQSNTLYVGIIGGLLHQYPNGINHPFKMAELLWGFFRTQVLP